jgi:hypothetical protein
MGSRGPDAPSASLVMVEHRRGGRRDAGERVYRIVIRLYFNRRHDPMGCWSVDKGPGTPEIKTNQVVVMGMYGRTATDFTQIGPEAVSAWVEFSDGQIRVDEVDESVEIS